MSSPRAVAGDSTVAPGSWQYRRECCRRRA